MPGIHNVKAARPRAREALGRTSLLGRIFLANAAVLALAVALLALTPLTISDPVVLHEAVVLVAGLTVILLANLALFRRAFAPLSRLTEEMRTVDLLTPGRRIDVESPDAEVLELATSFNDMLGRLEDERRQSAHRSLSAQEDERQRVAQELHDEIGQSLTAVVLQLDRLSRTAPEHMRKELAETRETARDSLEEVRHIAQRLRPEALDELGLGNALAALSQRVADQGNLQVVTRLDRALPTLSPQAELVIYRVAQEALTNVLRHAGAMEAVLTLRARERALTLTVSDDGSGMPDSAVPGAGIQGMRERALLVGGSLRVGPSRSGGTEVTLELESGEG